jgi:uncharacterized protein with GYD domain
MAHYMVTGSYTSEAWAAQVKNPQNRLEAIAPLFEASGGKIESAYYTFGENDIVLICEFPDNITAAAVSMIVASGGGVTNFNTIPLISMEDGVEAMKRASDLTYTPPKS